MRPMVVSSANLKMVFELCLALQSYVNRTQPCGIPVLWTNVEEKWLPIPTTYGLLVKKS